MSTLSRGAAGSEVRSLQSALKAAGYYDGTIDGKFGAGTQNAVEAFQEAKGLDADGKVGSGTRAALAEYWGDGFDSGSTAPTRPTTDDSFSGSSDAAVAKMNSYRNSEGMVTGKITVNGHTYDFNSGNGNSFSTPKGEFRVIKHMNSRSEGGYSRNGVGFTFQIEDPRRPDSDLFYDRRAGRDRENLRIHPDGGATGTAGCIGLLGSAATLKQFRADMNAAIDANGGSYKLIVQ